MNSDLTKIIQSRHSVRKWKQELVAEDVLADVLACAATAPSAHGSRPFACFTVSDTAVISQLLATRLQMIDEPFWINSAEWAVQAGVEKYSKVNLPPHIVVIAGDKTKLTDEQGMVQTLSAAAQNTLLAAHAHGLGACWLYVHDTNPTTENGVKRVLELGDNVKVLCLIAVGYPYP